MSCFALANLAWRFTRVFSCARKETGIPSIRDAAEVDAFSELVISNPLPVDCSFKVCSVPATCCTREGRYTCSVFNVASAPHSKVFANCTSSSLKVTDARRAEAMLDRAAAAVFS